MSSAALLMLSLLGGAPLPVVSLEQVDDGGCGRPAIGSTQLDGAAPGLCVRAAFAARLESPDVVNVVLHVDTRDGAPRPQRIFIYRLHGARLRPRFLGGGSRRLALRSVAREAGAELDSLRVEVADDGGVTRVLRCALEQFPLVCRPTVESPGLRG